MIFVPCRKGISHNPAEYSEPGQLAAGTRVLTQTLVDGRRLTRTRVDNACRIVL